MSSTFDIVKSLFHEKLGPFEGNTSHPILLVGNTAGALDMLDCCRSDLITAIFPDPVTPLWA